MFLKQKIYLLSNSKTRIKILKNIGLKLKTLNNNFNETNYHNKITQLSSLEDSINLSYLKLNNYLKNNTYKQNNIIVACDQTASCNGKKLYKATSEQDAFNKLVFMSGKNVELYSSFSVYKNGEFYKSFSKAVLKIKNLSKNDIESYLQVNKEIALSCLGCVDFEGKGIFLIEKVLEGDYYTILGFPVIEFLKTLSKLQDEK